MAERYSFKLEGQRETVDGAWTDYVISKKAESIPEGSIMRIE